jgi:beta-lactamase superfamily II metal-dependent hydrolase
MKRTVVLTFLLVCLSIISGSCITQTASPTASQTTPATSLPPEQSTATPTTAPGPATSVTPGELLVHFIDVGQGDAILIDFGETEVLIDGGDRSPGIVAYLSNYIDGAIEVIVATHPHADHIGGLIAVLEHFEVEDIWHNGEESDSKTYQDFMDAVQSENAEVHIARLRNVIQAGALSLYIHHPANLGGTTNNNSIVLHLAFGDIDFLFTGDAEREAEGNMMMLSSVRLPEVEILKVGHHGSRTASSQDFLSITSPEVAIYMAGIDNTYGHPHQETIEALKQIGAKIYGTDVNGTIVVSTNGETYTVQSIK